jgi:hypothetical protein
MENKSSMSKRKKPNVSHRNVSIVVFFFLVAACIIFMMSHFSTSSDATEGVSEEYVKLLLRAKELTKRYSDLSSRHGTSPDLSAQVEMATMDREKETHSIVLQAMPLIKQTSGGEDVKTLKASRRSAPNSDGDTDLVLGMAQDTDPKNLVRVISLYC